MKKPSRLAATLRNAAFRIVKRIPPGSVSPAVRNDRFQAQTSLFRFLAAFTANRRTLYLGEQPYGAYAMRRDAEAHVTAVLPSAAARSFGRRHYDDPWVRFTRAVSGTYEVVIADRFVPLLDLRTALEAGGKLLVVRSPAQDEAVLSSALKASFAQVRRFVQRTRAELDLTSPLFSTIPDEAFWFSEIPLDAKTPPDALAVVYLATDEAKWGAPQLHIGSGPVSLPGWINVDIKPYPGVDFCADVLPGIPFLGVKYIYAEHFIEHLSYPDAAKFMAACRDALRDDGILRLSTPNLDWVVHTSYTETRAESGDERLRDCFQLNRAFRAWGHQFLYNFAALEALLQNAGFTTIRAYTYGESDTPELAGLEHHEKYIDYLNESHIIIVEASGRADAPPLRGEEHIVQYTRDLGSN